MFKIIKQKAVEERLSTEVSVTKEIEVNQFWTRDYKEGFIDGLKRAKELLNPKN